MAPRAQLALPARSVVLRVGRVDEEAPPRESAGRVSISGGDRPSSAIQGWCLSTTSGKRGVQKSSEEHDLG